MKFSGSRAVSSSPGRSKKVRRARLGADEGDVGAVAGTTPIRIRSVQIKFSCGIMSVANIAGIIGVAGTTLVPLILYERDLARKRREFPLKLSQDVGRWTMYTGVIHNCTDGCAALSVVTSRLNLLFCSHCAFYTKISRGSSEYY